MDYRYTLAMGKVEKISIAVTPDMLSILQEAVDSGDYASSSDVMREALDVWSRQRDGDNGMKALRHLISEGNASGSAPYDGMADIREEGRRRLAEQRSGMR